MLAGMLATGRGIYSVFEGRATWNQKPVAAPGRPGMLFGVQVFDAGNAEEECNKTRQRYTLRVGLPSLFKLEDTQRSWIWLRIVLLLVLPVAPEAGTVPRAKASRRR